MRKSSAGVLQETDLSFLFSEFFEAFSATENGTLFSKSLEFDTGPVYEDYLQKGERLLSLAREKFTKVIGKIQLTNSEEKIFSSTFAENDSLYDIANKIARGFTRPLLKSIERLDDEYATKLIEAITLPSLHVFFEDIDSEKDGSYTGHIRRHFAKHKKTDVRIVRVCLNEEGFPPLVVYGALDHPHPNSIKCVVFEAGCCAADLGLFTAYLVIYKQLASTLLDMRTAEEEVEDTVYTAFKERIHAYERQFVHCNFSVFPAECDPLLEHFSLEEVFQHPVHMVGVERGFYPPFVTEFMDSHSLAYIDYPTYDACHKALRVVKDPQNVQFRLLSGHSQLCFNYFLKEHIPFHYLLFQFRRKDVVYWNPLPNSKSAHSGNEVESPGMVLLADLFRIIAYQKHSQQQMISYYRDLEKTYAKSYMLKKTTTNKIQQAMSKSLFNDYFGFVEFDMDTDIAKAEEIALEFKAVKESYFPAVDSNANAIRFRKLGQHKALGLYYPSLACLCVDIHSPSSLIHEYGHLIDYCYGGLSEKKEFTAVRKLYLEQFDKALEKDEALQKKMKSGCKYNRAYYTMPTEIFARCFELYVSQCLGVRNSIVPSTFENPGIYPANVKMLSLISQYFSSLPFMRSEIAEKELKCANA